MWLAVLAVAYRLAYAPTPTCGQPDLPPDPRCGDALDGREAPPDTGSEAGRAALAVPHALSQVVMWPVVETSTFTEHHKIPQWLRALTTSDDGLVGIRPELQYASGFAPAVGFHIFYKRLPGASQALVRFRTAGPDVIFTEARLTVPLGFTLDGGWNRRRDRLFAGIGPQSRHDPTDSGHEITRYAADIGYGNLTWATPKHRLLQAELGAGAEYRDYNSSDVRGGPSVTEFYGAPPATCAALGLPAPCVDPLLVPGFDSNRRLVRQRSHIKLDVRRPGRDASGLEIALDANHVQGVLGDRTHHAGLSVETVLSLGGLDRALILRGVAAIVEPLGTGFVPFDDLISPTGAGGMRGFALGRFRDRSGIVATAEWRWLVTSAVDASLFTDAGTVAGSWFSGLGWQNVYPDFGVGLRIFRLKDPPYWSAEPHYGLQVAYAPEPEVNLRLLLSVAGF
jgi:hypothetical protein